MVGPLKKQPFPLTFVLLLCLCGYLAAVSRENTMGVTVLPAVPEETTSPFSISEEDVLQVASASPASVRQTATGRVYLTIDDGPDILTTPAILDILDRYGVRATFFVIGRQAEKFPDLIKEMHSRGHYIGNHTYSHDYRDIYESKEAFLSSIQKNEELIFRLTGTRPKYIRDPGGKLREFRDIREHAEEAGYIIMGWNVDSYDSRNPVPHSKDIAANVLSQAEHEHLWPGMIILLHETRIRQNSVEALPAIIETLIRRGFTFHLPGEAQE